MAKADSREPQVLLVGVAPASDGQEAVVGMYQVEQACAEQRGRVIPEQAPGGWADID